MSEEIKRYPRWYTDIPEPIRKHMCIAMKDEIALPDYEGIVMRHSGGEIYAKTFAFNTYKGKCICEKNGLFYVAFKGTEGLYKDYGYSLLINTNDLEEFFKYLDEKERHAIRYRLESLRSTTNYLLELLDK